ncbi:MAG: hypothetical protein E7236_07320 [Lachnospiraceae bacterium]|nr:hypothetical protein [Lachnospiraceae bacterium]
MYNIKRVVDVKLNVQLVYVALIHEYVYEGPCRFGPKECLTKEFDLMNQGEIFKAWSGGYGGALSQLPGINLMDSIYIKMSDEFFITDEDEARMAEHRAETDLYIFTGMRCEKIAKEFAMKYHVPVAGEGMFASTVLASTLRARGYEEVYDMLDFPDAMRLLKALRAKKALRNMRILAATRYNSTDSLGGLDTVCNDGATRMLGVRYNYFSAHEFLDMMHLNENDQNHTLPGRDVYNLTDEDMVEVEKIVEHYISNAKENDMDRKYVVNSVKASVLARKLMEHFQCNAFTIPCPDLCATRRMNQEQFTFCFNHTILNEMGIPSACEYDLIGLYSIAALATLTNKAPYMANTQPCVYHDGKVEGEYAGISYIPEMDSDSNIYYTGHATPNSKMHGFDAEPMEYALRPFTASGFGATMRVDFNQAKGETITLMRFNPECTKIMVAKGTVVGGFGYDSTGCTEGIYFSVEDKLDYFRKQAQFGLHMPTVFGDHVEDVKRFGEIMGLEVVVA